MYVVMTKIKKYTQKERDYIIDNPHLTTREIAQYLGKKVNSVYDQRKKLTPNYKRIYRTKPTNKTCAFKSIIPFLKHHNFKTAAHAIKHYGSIREFKKQVKETAY